MQPIDQFCRAAEAAGTILFKCKDSAEAAAYIAEQAAGDLFLPVSSSCTRAKLSDQLLAAGLNLLPGERARVATAAAGVTSACFAIADTGTLVLESTPEDVRLASTLPPRHFVLLDRGKVVADGLAAVEPLRRMHQQQPRNYVAYITGPSRTADIERVLTIGVHGPKQLFVLLLDNWSNDLLEM